MSRKSIWRMLIAEGLSPAVIRNTRGIEIARSQGVTAASRFLGVQDFPRMLKGEISPFSEVIQVYRTQNALRRAGKA